MNLGLIIDSFAGGGGASTGIFEALGRAPDVAINHNEKALAMHQVNHPGTRHYVQDVWAVDPLQATQGKPVDLAWFSPDCTHHSRAKGGKPVSSKLRGLAWVALRWAATVRPAVIFLENVPEFHKWGPLKRKGRPDKNKKGITFAKFKSQLADLGYEVEFKVLRACDYGSPTTRERLFMVARCDGKPIVWPTPTHGAPDSPEVSRGELKPWIPAHTCIDWSIPCPSIFGRKRPLAEATLRRVCRGIHKFILESKSPFLAKVPWSGDSNSASVAAFLAKHYTGVTGTSLASPMSTVTSVDHHSLVAVSLVRMFGQSNGADIHSPAPTVVAGGQGKTALVAAHICKMRGTNLGHVLESPLHTVSAQGTHHSLVSVFLTKYYGSGESFNAITDPMHTVTTKDRFNLVAVSINNETYAITDIGLRMLQPRELYAAQGFPGDYVIDRGLLESGKWVQFTKTEQVQFCGNSVPPDLAKALVSANCAKIKNKQQKIA